MKTKTKLIRWEVAVILTNGHPVVTYPIAATVEDAKAIVRWEFGTNLKRITKARPY